MMGVGSFIVYTFKNTRWVPPSLKSLNSDPLQMPFFVCIFLFSHLNSLIFTLTLPTTAPHACFNFCLRKLMHFFSQRKKHMRYSLSSFVFSLFLDRSSSVRRGLEPLIFSHETVRTKIEFNLLVKVWLVNLNLFNIAKYFIIQALEKKIQKLFLHLLV